VRFSERFPSKPAVVAADDLESSFWYRYYSSEKAKRKLGWTPKHTFAQTVRDEAQDLVAKNLLVPYPERRG
jgi:nucleoside-diphosphate-sugar epimerase